MNVMKFSDGIETADKLGYDHKYVYKTLVTTGKSGRRMSVLFLSRKKSILEELQKFLRGKPLEMLHLKELTKVTGYVRGGCTSIGMKKQFPTVIQEDAKELEHMHVSGGKLGMQLTLLPEDLAKAANAQFADVIHKDLTEDFLRECRGILERRRDNYG